MATYNHFYDLPVYKVCRLFRKEISLIVKKHFPKTETYNLSAQILDSSRSITSNITEGFGRFHYQENIQFCKQSRGSLTETMEHIITAYDDKYIGKEIVSEINKNYKECLKQINGYIKYLKDSKSGNSDK